MSADLKIDIKDVTKNFDRLGDEAVKAAASALYVEGNLAMTTAKRDTPVDTGALRSSGHVEHPLTVGPVASVTLGFGGASAPYALYVHENLHARHPVGKAKFLEGALQGISANITTKIAARIKQAWQ